MKSKFSAGMFGSIIAGALLLVPFCAFLVLVIIAPAIAILIKVCAAIVLLLISRACFRNAKLNWNKIRIDKEAIHISPFFGLWTNKVRWENVSAIERVLNRGEDSDSKIFYIYIDNVKTVEISDANYENMYNLYRSLSKKTNVLGSEYIVQRRESEVETPTPILTSLVTGIPGVVMIGMCVYIGIDQLNFAQAAVQVPGKITELRESDMGSFAVVSFDDQQGHGHRCRSNMAAGLQALNQGDSVQVLFSPASPDDAQIDSFPERWGMSLVYGIVGVGLVGAALWQLRKGG